MRQLLSDPGSIPGASTMFGDLWSPPLPAAHLAHLYSVHFVDSVQESAILRCASTSSDSCRAWTKELAPAPRIVAHYRAPARVCIRSRGDDELRDS